MTLVRLSSKGQLVIPRSIRQALGLHPGTQFEIQLEGRRIVLEPVEVVPPLEALYGKYPGTDFLADLEQEHQHELNNE
jgi:AbrB family looped-hinge helix DNA binding protein